MQGFKLGRAKRLTEYQLPILKMLQDLVHHVQIQSNFWITHDSYSTWELRPELSNGLQQLPMPVQDQYLRVRLGSYLLGIYNTQSENQNLMPNPDFASLPNQEASAQNQALGVHSSFYKALHANNCGQGYFDSGWLVLGQDAEGLLAVQKDALTLHVNLDRHLSRTEQDAKIGDLVAVRLPQNRLENDSYVAIGNAGDPAAVASSENPLVNFYFHLGAEDLVSLMGDLTTALNPLELLFTFQVPYEAENCDRPDAGILKIAKADYGKLKPILKTLYRNRQSVFHPETALFTKQLAPGFAVAEDPTHRFTRQESFSMHRFQIVADGYLKAWRQGEKSPDLRIQSILQSFAAHSVDVDCPFLNANSEDCYLPL